MDVVLAERCRHGDPAAFAELVRATSDRVYRLAYRLSGNRHDALDMVQEAYAAVWVALPTLRQPESFRGWFLQVASNACRDWLRRRRRLPVPLAPEEIHAASPDSPESAVVTRETQASVQAAIRALPPDYAVTIALFYEEGLSYRELAAVLDVPVRTVETRLRRAREMLRRKLQRYERTWG